MGHYYHIDITDMSGNSLWCGDNESCAYLLDSIPIDLVDANVRVHIEIQRRWGRRI